MTRRAFMWVAIAYAFLAVGVIVSQWMILNQSDSLDRTQKAIAITQLKSLEILRRGQVYDCEDRTELRKDTKLPPARAHTPGDCDAVAHAYDLIIHEAEQTVRQIEGQR